MNGERRRRLGGLTVACLAACAAGPAPVVVSPPTGPSRPPGWCTLDVGFEPPLPAPVDLYWRHETGAHGRLRTACTEVRLLVPPGPLVLTLGAAPGASEWALRVDGDTVVGWPADRLPGGDPPRAPRGSSQQRDRSGSRN